MKALRRGSAINRGEGKEGLFWGARMRATAG